MFVILAVAHSAVAGAPVGGRLMLETLGAFQSYDYQSGWLDSDEQSLREEVRTTFTGYLLDQTFANYRLGVALDNRTLYSADAPPTSRLGYGYDGRVSLWQGGTVPVVLFASHQTGVPQIEESPTNQSSSDTFGYQASVVTRGLPKLDTAGRYQVLEAVEDGERSRQVMTDLRASVFQAGKSNHERGSIDWQTTTGPTEGSSRDRRAASLDIDARLNDDVEIIARTDAHRHQTEINGDTFALGNTASDALVRYRITDRTNGVVFIEQHRSMLDDAQYSGVVAGAQLAHRFESGVRTEAEVGATYDEAETDAEGERYVGEFLRTTAGHSAAGGWGTYELTAQAGVAHFAQLDVSGGPQAGGSIQATYGRPLGPVGTLFAGGEVNGLADGSGLDQGFMGEGWRGGFTSRRILGLTLGADASGSRIDTLAPGEGDSERTRVNGHATLQVAAFLTGDYSATYDRIALDGEWSEGMGHVAQLDVEVSGTIHVSAIGYQTRWATANAQPTEWWRAEAALRWQILGAELDARISRDFTVVGGDERGATKVLVTLSRRFGWDL